MFKCLSNRLSLFECLYDVPCVCYCDCIVTTSRCGSSFFEYSTILVTSKGVRCGIFFRMFVLFSLVLFAQCMLVLINENGSFICTQSKVDVVLCRTISYNKENVRKTSRVLPFGSVSGSKSTLLVLLSSENEKMPSHIHNQEWLP